MMYMPIIIPSWGVGSISSWQELLIVVGGMLLGTLIVIACMGVFIGILHLFEYVSDRRYLNKNEQNAKREPK